MGLAAIEFALMLPTLLIIAFVLIDFGRVLFQYDTLTKSTRDATRYLAGVVKPPVNDSAYDVEVTRALNLSLCGSINACGSNTLVNGLTAANIIVDYPAKVGNIAYVRIRVENYSSSFLTSVLGINKNLGVISVTMRQV